MLTKTTGAIYTTRLILRLRCLQKLSITRVRYCFSYTLRNITELEALAGDVSTTSNDLDGPKNDHGDLANDLKENAGQTSSGSLITVWPILCLMRAAFD